MRFVGFVGIVGFVEFVGSPSDFLPRPPHYICRLSGSNGSLPLLRLETEKHPSKFLLKTNFHSNQNLKTMFTECGKYSVWKPRLFWTVCVFGSSQGQTESSHHSVSQQRCLHQTVFKRDIIRCFWQNKKGSKTLCGWNLFIMEPILTENEKKWMMKIILFSTMFSGSLPCFLPRCLSAAC